MVLKLDPRLVEPLVAHARGEAVAAPASTDAAEDSSGDGSGAETEGAETTVG